MERALRILDRIMAYLSLALAALGTVLLLWMVFGRKP